MIFGISSLPYTPFSYLKHYAEDMPDWLTNYTPEEGLSFADVMSGRTAYYPGCGDDGSLITLCSASHCCHSYIYLDYLFPSPEEFLNNVSSIKTYDVIGHHEWSENDVFPCGTSNPATKYTPKQSKTLFCEPSTWRCFTIILQRKSDRGDSWGVKRFALTFLNIDAIETYFQLYIHNYQCSPFIILLEDYGLGGNYDYFGQGGYLEAIMQTYNNYPPFALIGHSTPWKGYLKLEGIAPMAGGEHHYNRFLYARPASFDGIKSLNDF